MRPVTILSPDQLLPNRRFTDPQWTVEDHQLLCYMAEQVCMLLRHPAANLEDQIVVRLQPSADSDWIHRIIIVQPKRLNEIRPITLVGFFGQRNPHSSIDLGAQTDRMLQVEFPQQPDLLSYSTLMLSDSNYCNLVLFASPAGIVTWSQSNTHRYAVTEFAPRYYRSVRIHNGLLPDGIHHFQTLRIEITKYLDYRSQPLWYAERSAIS